MVKGIDLDKLHEQKLHLFISQDKAEKERLYGKLFGVSSIMRSTLNINLIPLRKHSIKLIAFLQKEYHPY